MLDEDRLYYSENWLPICGYNGVYYISDLGRVKSRKNGIERILKGDENNCGYIRVTLYRNGRKTRHFVHRLVAEHFIPNPCNYNMVNHKNEIKYDNRLENLEWCDGSYNQLYGTIRIRKSIGRKRYEIHKATY